MEISLPKSRPAKTDCLIRKIVWFYCITPCHGDLFFSSPPKTDAHDAYPKQDVKEAGMRMDVITSVSGAITSFNLPLWRSVDGELKSFCNPHLPSFIHFWKGNYSCNHQLSIIRRCKLEKGQWFEDMNICLVDCLSVEQRLVECLTKVESWTKSKGLFSHFMKICTPENEHVTYKSPNWKGKSSSKSPFLGFHANFAGCKCLDAPCSWSPPWYGAFPKAPNYIQLYILDVLQTIFWNCFLFYRNHCLSM